MGQWGFPAPPLASLSVAGLGTDVQQLRQGDAHVAIYGFRGHSVWVGIDFE